MAAPRGRLADKHAIVTGAERGIGRAIAIGFAEQGAAVAVTYLDDRAAAEEVIEAVQATGQRGVAIFADFSKATDLNGLVSEAENELGRIDVLVNNAGALIRRPFLDTSRADLEVVLAVDLVAPFGLSQEIARRLVDAEAPGSIINVTSVSQERSAVGLVAYQAAKAGAWMLTRGMALELAPHGIRVNAIAPGTTVTALNERMLADESVAAQRLATIPLGRFGRPDDHVGAAIYLASDESSWVTGATLVIDGGITTR